MDINHFQFKLMALTHEKRKKKRIKMISLLTNTILLMLKVAMALLAFVLLITLLFGTHVTLVLMTRLCN